MHLAVLFLLHDLAAARQPFPGAPFAHRAYSREVSEQVKACLAVLLAAEAAGCAVLVVRHIRWWGLVVAAALISTAALWSREDETVEGGVLVTITQAHGIVISDLLSVQAGLVALAIVARFGLQRRRSRSSS